MWLSSCKTWRVVKMAREIGQFDIPDRQLLATKAQTRVDMRTDIGEAKIVHTIFGRAKVRIILDRDKKRRAWLLATLAVTVLVTAAWQGWIAFQQTQNVAPPISETVRVSAPVFQPEEMPATLPSERDKQKTPTQIVFDSMSTRREPAPQPPLDLKTTKQMTVKPVTAQPLITSKPEAASLATNNNSSNNQADIQPPPAPIQPVAAIDATLPATQPEPNMPSAVAPPVEPLIKEDTPNPLPASGNQPSGTINAQP
jgi:hypothetical protein